MVATLLCCVVGAFAVGAQPTRTWAQPAPSARPTPSASASAAPAASVSAAPSASASAAPSASASAAPAGSAPALPAPSPSVQPPLSPDPPSAQADAVVRGTLVVAVGADARPHARRLARRVYAQPSLTPAIDEVVAAVLAGGEPPEGDAAAAELAQTVAALATVSDAGVRRRLAVSMAQELDAERVVLVDMGDDGPRGRVVEGGRYLGVTLAARRGDDDTWTWDDAVALLRGLSLGRPAPGPRKPATAPEPAVPLPTVADEEEPDDGSLLTSPWFWTGLGVVVTVGVTVIVLSQTVFKDEESVTLQGQVGL